MPYCTVCGTEITGNFCPRCGKAAPQYHKEDNRYSSVDQNYGYRRRYDPDDSYYDGGNPYSYSYVTERHVPVSNKSRLVALLLCIFFGYIGVHQFYVGRTGYGILYLLTGGLFGIGCLVDLILLATGSFKDEYGFFVSDWNA